METVPLTGKVTVDGQPVERLLVQCHPQGDADHSRVLSGRTDATGTVSFSTYVSGDGVPPGDYKLTFQLMKSEKQFGPEKDHLKGKYANPKTTEFQVTAKPGEQNDFGLIDLATE